MIREKKKDNIFIAYFKPFGIKQICHLLMLVGAILAIVGVFTNNTLMLAGLIVFMVADVPMLVKHILVLTGKTSRKSPEYRNAIIDTCTMGVLFLLALFGLIYHFVA